MDREELLRIAAGAAIDDDAGEASAPLSRQALLDIAAADPRSNQALKLSFARSLAARRRRNGTPASRSLRIACVEAQREHINRDLAVKLDDRLPDSRGQREAPLGSGNYRKPTVEQVQRDMFAGPEKTMASIAGKKRCSKYVASWMLAGSKLLITLQHGFMERKVNEFTPSFVVGQIIFDETKNRILHSSKRGRATDSSTFATHGRILCGNNDGHTIEDEVVIPPSVMESNTAACMQNILQHSLPPVFARMWEGKLPEGARMGCIASGSDEHSANKFLLAYLDGVCGDDVIILKGWCKQHGTGNIMEPPLRHLGIYSPAFCLAKRLRDDSFYKRLMNKGLKDELRERMVWVRQGQNPTWQPEESDVRCSREIMELAYRKRLLFRTGGNAEDDEAVREAKAAERRREIEQFVHLFPFKWTSSTAEALG